MRGENIESGASLSQRKEDPETSRTIASANSIDDLIGKIRANNICLEGTWKGEPHTFSTDELVQNIEKADQTGSCTVVTRTAGLRDKVIELLNQTRSDIRIHQ